jgi:hypothetical protein
MYWLSWNLGAWTSWNPEGLSRPVQEMLYILTVKFMLCNIVIFQMLTTKYYMDIHV